MRTKVVYLIDTPLFRIHKLVYLLFIEHAEVSYDNLSFAWVS